MKGNKTVGVVTGLFVVLTAVFAFTGGNSSDVPSWERWVRVRRSEDTAIFIGSMTDTTRWPTSFGIGRAVSKTEIAEIDISIKPSGAGLPAGSGTATAGQAIYEIKCMACHGKNGSGGISSALVGAFGDTVKAKTIGNYWPYATTLFDYIRRAMPFNMPGSLNNNEVYSLTAYLLYKNKITEQGTVINATSLPKIKMPAQSLFINDNRQGGPEIK